MASPVQSAIGAFVIELFFAFILYGFTTLQTFMYYQMYPDDKRTIKYLVGAVWIIETVHTGLCMEYLYAYLVTGFGDFRYLQHVNWGVGGSALCSVGASLCVQSYYTWRIWIVSGNSKIWTGLIGACVVIRVALGIGSFAQAFIHPEWLVLRQTTSAFVTFSGGLGMAALVDVLVAGGLSLHLTRNRHLWNRDSESMVNRILIYSVNTGAITGVTSLMCAILFVVPDTGLAFLGLTMMQTKLYANSLLGSLNARSYVRNKGSNPGGHMFSTQLSGGTGSGLRVTSPRVPRIEILQSTTTEHDGAVNRPQVHRDVSDKEEYALQVLKSGELA